jgi:hypothetical protein
VGPFFSDDGLDTCKPADSSHILNFNTTRLRQARLGKVSESLALDRGISCISLSSNKPSSGNFELLSHNATVQQESEDGPTSVTQPERRQNLSLSVLAALGGSMLTRTIQVCSRISRNIGISPFFFYGTV